MTMAERDEREPARAEGGVLWIYGQAWEDGEGLDGLHPPTPFDEWVAFLEQRDWTVGWTAKGALDEGPYRSGAVVEVDVGDRAYVAVPPELLDRLREVMPERDYRMTREDVAALGNPEAHGLRVTRLAPVAWEQRPAKALDWWRSVVPIKDLPTEGWARAIRAHNLRVEAPFGAMLPLDSAWPAGQVVTVTGGRAHHYYFAVPRGALRLAGALHLETRKRNVSATPESVF